MRASGILMHISSLPNGFLIGTLGKSAYEFADFLKKAGQSYWQILPISPTSYGDSPYQSFSIYAGNPYFIDAQLLEKDGLLRKSEYAPLNSKGDGEDVDFELLYKTVFKVFRKAYRRFTPEDDYKEFEEKNTWLDEYALFMALKDAHNGKAWEKWEKPLRNCEKAAIKEAKEKYRDDIGFYKFLQYEFYRQWGKLKEYVNSLGIKMIGDIPIYVAYDSADVWVHPEYFQLDENKVPTDVAGCPPDVFAAKGQLWGNPLYRWDIMKKENYKWWTDRIKAASEIYDVVRIDHFRGFESYYAIPYGREDAVIGEWRKGPGTELFREVKKQLGKTEIIAEDLGFLTPKVKRMLKASGYPGMKVLEFMYDENYGSDYLPHNFKNTNSVCYTGTHDNETLVGWVNSLSRKEARFFREYLNVSRNKDIAWAMIRLAWSSVSDTAIAQMQDFLELGSNARMNIPSTLGGNWQWRARSGVFTDELAQRILNITKMYNRLGDKQED